VSVRLSVCPVVRQQQRRAAGLLLVAQWAGDVDAQDAQQQSCAYWFTSAFRGPHRATCRTPSARSRVRNHGVACAPRNRPISSCRRRDVQQWATAPSPSQHRAPGTVCRTRSVAAHLWPSSNALRKLTFIARVFINIVFITFSPRAVNILKCP